MKADREDSPSYLREGDFKQSVRIWGIPTLLGTCIALGLLQAGSSLLLKNTIQSLAHPPRQQSAPAATINYSAPINDQDKWHLVVEEQLHRDNPHALIKTPKDLKPTTSPKQTVVHNQNYVPRGADNVVSLCIAPEPYQLNQPTEQKVRATIVGETPNMKDRACWPLKAGSVEKRNYNFSVGLNNRANN